MVVAAILGGQSGGFLEVVVVGFSGNSDPEKWSWRGW
jgi:hypothetical protein